MRPVPASHLVVVPLTQAQVVALVPLTDWLDVSSLSDVYIPLANVDAEGEDVTFTVETAEETTHPFVNRTTLTLQPGEADAYVERGKFYRFVRISAQSTSAEPVDVKFAVFGKGGTKDGAWKLG